jgi:hypothetical protein
MDAAGAERCLRGDGIPPGRTRISVFRVLRICHRRNHLAIRHISLGPMHLPQMVSESTRIVSSSRRCNEASPNMVLWTTAWALEHITRTHAPRNDILRDQHRRVLLGREMGTLHHLREQTWLVGNCPAARTAIATTNLQQGLAC